MKTQFLPNAGDPPLKWTVWYQISGDHLVATGMDSVSEAPKLAILRSSLGTEGYRISTEFSAPWASYSDTVEQLKNRFARKQSTIYARAQFNRRIQSSHETCLDYATALRALARKYNYPDEIFDELERDPFVAACANDRLRENFLLEPDELTLAQAVTIAQPFERATSELATVSRCNPSDFPTHWVQRKISKLEYVLHREAVQWEAILLKDVDLHHENHLELGLSRETEQVQEGQHISGVGIHSAEFTSAKQQASNAKPAVKLVISTTM